MAYLEFGEYSKITEKMQSIKDHYSNLIIGFGKGGKTLAAWLSAQGEEVAIVEKSKKMYGGTCINIACIPTKSLITNAEKGIPYSEAHQIKDKLTAELRQKNYNKIAHAKNADVIDGEASFVSPGSVKITTEDGEKIISAGRIFINTGAKPFLPPIKGVNEKNIYTSTTLMELEEKPQHLLIVGGGFVGLEFADMFLKFGSKVTVLDNMPVLLPREDRDMAGEILKVLTQKGLQLISEATVNQFSTKDNSVQVNYKKGNDEFAITTDAVLMATGRIPDTQSLNLQAAGIKTNERGFIMVNDKLQTTAKNVWAIGDVNAGPQFTYISLDDFRIIKNQLSGKTYTSVTQRKPFPTTVFTSPPYARTGINETEAKAKNIRYKVNTWPAAAVPKANILQQNEGLMKVIVEEGTDKILGCMLFCAEAHELINIVQIAINAGLTYDKLRDNIYTHPSMAESFNDLFSF